jgi:WD40 repeat protein
VKGNLQYGERDSSLNYNLFTNLTLIVMFGSSKVKRATVGPELDDFIDDDVIDQWEDSLRHKNAPKLGTDRASSSGLVSDLFDREILSHLEDVFANSTSGNNALLANEFRSLIARYIPYHLVESIYRSIDVNDVGYINYSDFTNYLIASEASSTFSSRAYMSRLVMNMQQEEETGVTHKDSIDCMVYVKKPFAMIITGGRDGQISLWYADTLELITHIQHRDKNSVYGEELHRTMDKVLIAKCAKMSTAKAPPKRKQTKVHWVNIFLQ